MSKTSKRAKERRAVPKTNDVREPTRDLWVSPENAMRKP